VSMQPIDSWLHEEEARREPETFPCPVDGCARVLATAGLLRGHLESVHRAVEEEEPRMPELVGDETKEAFRCALCGRVFQRAQGLGIHRTRKHGSGKPTKKAATPIHDGQVSHPELRLLGGILKDAERLSPAGRAWLAAQLTQNGGSTP
jgi:hypothetical protein